MSDQSLRDALEKLARERDSVSGHSASDYHIRPYELFELLAAHPVEPARPLLDREAVKAALQTASTPPVAVGGSQFISGTANDFTDAVMELARPVPTREQIAQSMHDHMMEHGWRQGCREDVCIAVFLGRADAMLELLNGAES